VLTVNTFDAYRTGAHLDDYDAAMCAYLDIFNFSSEFCYILHGIFVIHCLHELHVKKTVTMYTLGINNVSRLKYI